jgi:hypothetical protein
MSRLAEIYRQEKKSGGGLTSTITKRLGEKIDPRQMLDSSGIIATMFPGLKPYSATKQKTPSATSSMPSISSGAGELSIIAEATKITAKNTLAMPAMARDMYLMKQNMVKLVKLQGGTPTTKAGDFFNRQQARESAFENKMGTLGKIGGSIGASNLTSILGKKRDGQSPGSALFIKDSGGFDVSDMLPSLLKGAALPAMLTPVLAALGPLLLAGAGLSLLGALFVKLYKSKGAFVDEEESKRIDDIAKTGGLAGQKNEQDRIKKLPEYERTKAEIAQYEKTFNEGQKLGEMQLAGYAKRGAESARAVEDYKKANNIGQTPAPTPAPAAPATATAATPMPENTVTSGSGSPIMTGSGLPLTSGESSPSKVSGSIPSGSGIPIDYQSYAQKIGEKESGGKYDAVNTLGYLGKYQFGAMALQDMGLVKKGTSLKGLDDPASWNIEGGKKAFLNNPQLQEDTMVKYTKQNFATLNRIGVINDKSSQQEIAGYLAASHLLGPGGAKQLAQGKVGSDAYGTSSATYFKVGSATQGTGAGATSAVASAPAAAPTAGGGGGGATLAAAAAPSTGSTVASASSSVSDGRRASSGGGNVVVDNSQRTTVASSQPSGKPTSAYDRDIVSVLVSGIAA